MATKKSVAKTTVKKDAKKSDLIGWGIVGCGVIAPTHANAVGGSGTANLVAVCDVVPGKAKAFAEKYAPGARAYESMEAMLKDPEIQAVSICTPSGMHADCCIAAAEMGKHILCEKPMDVTLEAIDAAIAACKEHDVKLSGVFQRRTYASSRKVREAVK
ncbi:MAG: Gfo/Idh/MocA family protein, partial [Bacteroidota bacterium]